MEATYRSIDAGEMVDLMYVLCKDDAPSHLRFLVVVVWMLLLGLFKVMGLAARESATIIKWQISEMAGTEKPS